MNGPIDWRALFSSPVGRCSRGRFWFAASALFIVAILYEAAAGPTAKLLTFWFVYPLLIASAACVLSKRLHDRGRSGWWAALVLLGVALAWQTPNGGRLLLALPILVWAGVELVLMAGEQGANRFGPNPASAAA
ncbi:MAG TPA: DUF805 domain-containing protein [Caulobacteraceae bacterium]|jgi:uncharacterized membrane protein YhaH (DUF805 family)